MNKLPTGSTGAGVNCRISGRLRTGAKDCPSRSGHAFDYYQLPSGYEKMR
jgi:hypothetical protein